MIMTVGDKVLIVLRLLVLVSALVVVGLGAWSKFIIHDVEVRGPAILERAQAPERIVGYWQEFFTAVTNGTMRIWISIAAASLAFLTMLLVILSTLIRRLKMSFSVLIPIEILSKCAIGTAFGCILSFAFSLSRFMSNRLEASSDDLIMFEMVVSLSKGLVVTAGTGFFLAIATTVTAMVQACLRKRFKESCSFEPTASALGMGTAPEIVPPMPRSRVPTMYDPFRPLPSQRNAMHGDDEKSLLKKSLTHNRTDSGSSGKSGVSIDVEKAWPLVVERPAQAQIRPSRPWSELSETRRVHAL